MNKKRWLWLPAKAVQNTLLALLIATCSILFTSGDSHYVPEFAPFYALERAGYDFLFFFRGSKLDRIDPRIMVVGFDHQSEVELKTRWPAPRNLHAKVIRNLAKDGASLIVYDVLFWGATNPKDDKDLDLALKQAGNVVQPMRIDRDYVQKLESLEEPYYNDDLNIDFLSNSVDGCAEVPQDVDGVVRRYTPFMYFQDEPKPSMAAAAYLKLRGLDQNNLTIRKDGFQVGDVMIPRSGPVIQDPFNTRFLIPSAYMDFPAGNASFGLNVTFTDLVKGTFPKGTFRGKIVFVGRTGQELNRENYDLFVTAFTNHSDDSLSGSMGWVKTMPGVFLQALNLNALLHNGFIVKAPIWSVWILVFGLVVAGAAGVRSSFNWRGPAILFLCTLLYVGYSITVFSRFNFYVPWVVPSLLMMSSIILVTYFERGALRRKWSRYVSPQVLERIIKGEEEGAAQRYRASVVFGDIRGFTAFTTLHTPETVVKLLNAHFEKMTTIIYEEHGTIDKFMGDGVMALFGAPVPIPNDAVCAVRAAWRMCEASKEPLTLDGESFVLSSGFGVTNGFLVAGHVGSKVRHDYTVIGDVVNIASRLQGVTNSSDVVIDSTTMRLVSDHFEVESLGEVFIKGLPEHMECYRVTGMRDLSTSRKRKERSRPAKTGIS